MPTRLPIAVTAATLSTDLREAARAARTLAFDGLLIELAGEYASLLELSDTGQREVRHILSAQNQLLAGLDLRLPNKALRPESDLDQVLERIERAMRAARGLRAGVLCVDLGLLPPPPPEPAPPRPKITPAQAGLILIPDMAASAEQESARPAPAADPAFAASAESALRELGRRADRIGVMLAFRSELSSFRALQTLLDRVDCPWFGVDLDPVAVLEDDWSMDEVFDRLGTRVRHVRARDAVRGTDRRTQPAPVGRGDTGWAALLSNLDAAGYRQFVTVDPTALPDRRAAALLALNHLRPSAE